MYHQMVVSSDLTPDWLEKRKRITTEIERQLIAGIREGGKGLTLEQLQIVTEHRNPFPEKAAPTVISQDLANGGVTYALALNTEAFMDDWSKFLKEVFKLGLPSRKKIILPKTRPGFGWGIITPGGMTIERAIQSYADICPIWRWTDDDLDGITTSVRNADNTHVVWVRDRIEADEEQRGKSYNDLQIAGISGITLSERLLLGRWFYYKTSRHLDVFNVTRCDGSLCSDCSDGRVPGVSWRDGGIFSLRKFGPDFCNDDVRSREAVV